MKENNFKNRTIDPDWEGSRSPTCKFNYLVGIVKSFKLIFYFSSYLHVIQGECGMKGIFATRIAGSADLYQVSIILFVVIIMVIFYLYFRFNFLID